MRHTSILIGNAYGAGIAIGLLTGHLPGWLIVTIAVIVGIGIGVTSASLIQDRTTK